MKSTGAKANTPKRQRRVALIRAKDAARRGGAGARPARLVRSGKLVRVGRGIYADPNHALSEHASLAEVALRHPEAVVCLLSALRFHELTTQSPGEVWIAVGNKARAPRQDYPPLRVVRFSAKALTSGVAVHSIDGVRVRVTTVAKTVADCFKFRNKLGLDVALEALREAVREKRMTMDELRREARVCRMTRVLQPYLESLS